MSCSKCDHSWHEGTVKYRVVVREMDSTCDAPLLIWDKECYDLVGVSASSLREKYAEGCVRMQMLFQNIVGIWNLKCISQIKTRRIGLAYFEMVGFDEVVYLEVLGAH
nr:replication protein A 70 kDa DNA-binding subunit B-like [Ipomoea batatas]